MSDEIEQLKQELEQTKKHLADLVEVVSCPTTDIRSPVMYRLANEVLKALNLPKRHPVGAHYSK
jgi:hypothetical protein